MVKKIRNDAIFKKPATTKTNRSKKNLKIFSKKKKIKKRLKNIY